MLLKPLWSGQQSAQEPCPEQGGSQGPIPEVVLGSPDPYHRAHTHTHAIHSPWACGHSHYMLKKAYLGLDSLIPSREARKMLLYFRLKLVSWILGFRCSLPVHLCACGSQRSVLGVVLQEHSTLFRRQDLLPAMSSPIRLSWSTSES